MSLVDRVNGRFAGVQALRFVAAFLVVLGHAAFYTRGRLTEEVPVWNWSSIGVDIFFIISGFVMVVSSRDLIGRRDGWKYFATRRVVRIVPMYWLVTTIKLITVIVIPSLVINSVLDPRNVVFSYLFIPFRNADGDVEPLHGVGWTLEFEMFFYAIFTIALLVRAKPLILCGGVLAALGIASIFRVGDDWPAAFFYADPFALYFLVGMILGTYAAGGSRRWFLAQMLGVVALFAVVWGFRQPTDEWFGVGHIVRALVAISLVTAVALTEPRIGSRLPRAAGFLGDTSYALYLFHPIIAPIVPAVMAFVGLTNGALSIFGCVVVSIVGGIVIYLAIERPITRRLQRTVPYVRILPSGNRSAPVDPDSEEGEAPARADGPMGQAMGPEPLSRP